MNRRYLIKGPKDGVIGHAEDRPTAERIQEVIKQKMSEAMDILRDELDCLFIGDYRMSFSGDTEVEKVSTGAVARRALMTYSREGAMKEIAVHVLMDVLKQIREDDAEDRDGVLYISASNISGIAKGTGMSLTKLCALTGGDTDVRTMVTTRRVKTVGACEASPVRCMGLTVEGAERRLVSLRAECDMLEPKKDEADGLKSKTLTKVIERMREVDQTGTGQG